MTFRSDLELFIREPITLALAREYLMKRTLQERFKSRFQKPESGCWLWAGHIDRDGYGKFTFAVPGSKIRNTGAHRLSYEIYVGPIPEGLQIDHLCRTRNCVRPDHLEPVTGKENTRRSPKRFVKGELRSHCKNGHSLSGSNLGTRPDGYRRCHACMRGYQANYLKRRTG